jgi:hypothetical protein
MSWQELVRTQIKGNTDKLTGINKTLTASSTWDPPATAATQGAEVSTTIAVPGAVVGDPVIGGHSGFDGSLAAEIEFAVSAADTVKARIINTTAVSVNVPTGTLKVTVIK